ncbi:hypothetical protein QTJ16_005456 [Diplocarpon rosae]|uniref:Uncharacterized protein n=1 Tax=Diplocarpon rosae TaxID=946125 RepID=A0AAD9SXZ4_9HELO|nr:hypothetical protein QTJ16_005456 [Diplocarpon rosae]
MSEGMHACKPSLASLHPALDLGNVNLLMEKGWNFATTVFSSALSSICRQTCVCYYAW